MRLTSEDADEVFFLSEKNRAFAVGETSELGFGRLVNALMSLFVLIGLPIGLFLALITTLIFGNSLLGNLVQYGVIMVGLIIWMGISGSRRRKQLVRDGQVLRGALTGIEPRWVFSGSGYSRGARANFTFTTPDGNDLAGVVIVSKSTNHLYDGREIPPPGTPVAVIYVNDKLYSLL